MKEIKGIPKVSQLRFYANARKILKNPLPFHHERFEALGDTFQLDVGWGRTVIFSRDPALAEYVLAKNQKNYTKSPIQTKDVAKYVGKGLLTSEGEHWRKQRKLIQPAFHKKQLVNLLGSMYAAIKEELEKIQPDKPMNIFPVFNDLAFQTVVKSLFSSAVGQEEIDRLQYITESAQKMLVRELRQPYLNWWFKWHGDIQHNLDLTGQAREILKKLIEHRKATGVLQNDLLDMLLDARYDDGSAMSENQLIDEILILFTAGHETTSNALTFTCELLARHPGVQEKVAAEVKEAKENSEDLFDFLRKCGYTQNVIEESMRLYPPAYFIDRVNIDEDEFEGKHFPAGSNLLLSVYAIHRNAKFWEKPQEFIPERFSETRQTNYYPFGAGPRKCIGNNFAMYEMVLAMAEVINRYKISSTKEEIEILPLITLKPKNAILRFQKR